MRTIHSTQVVTPFGSGYVPEDHGNTAALQEPANRSWIRLAVVMTVALFAATTAGAITASSRTCAPVPKLWLQPDPTILMKLPDVPRVEEPIY
jgi:hypothetical protein